ncbi:hypothetical protein ACFQ6Q_00700 [Streptomyces sp. NPDC056437]
MKSIRAAAIGVAVGLVILELQAVFGINKWIACAIFLATVALPVYLPRRT